MADNPLVVALLKEYRDEASITKTEAGRIMGLNRNQIAGITNRNKEKIGPWPELSDARVLNRGCQFPINQPGTPDFRLCGIFRQSDPLCCEDHKKKKWVAEAVVIPMKKK